MEKINGRMVAIISLVISVIALAIGFSSFADEFDIYGEATLRKNEAFDAKVRFNPTSIDCTYANEEVITENYNSGSIVSDDIWSGISVPLFNEGNKKAAICHAKIENGSSYLAYLTGLAATNNVICEAVDSINDPVTNLADVCGANNANIAVTVAIGNDMNSTDKIVLHKEAVSLANPTGVIPALSGQTKGETTVWVKFEYTGNVEPDGAVRILLPTVAVDYSTVRSS